jgi:regulator of sirC expression with transglutaminase-like and TPR domain
VTESWNPRERFAALATLPDSQIALDEAALWIAAEEYPELDVAGYMGELDALAEAARSRLLTARSDTERITQLNRFLFVEAGFHGNRDDYHDPRNSYLNEVLERRCGIPISLSLVYLAVTARLGLAVQGVGFPGHFLLKWQGDPGTLVDPFDGKPLSMEDCEKRLHSLGEAMPLQPELHLRAASSREILARILGNLKQVFLSRGDFEQALAQSERILLLYPDAATEVRDRGLIFEQLACFAAAAADLDHFLELAPEDPGAEDVRARLAAVRARIGPLH